MMYKRGHVQPSKQRGSPIDRKLFCISKRCLQRDMFAQALKFIKNSSEKKKKEKACILKSCRTINNVIWPNSCYFHEVDTKFRKSDFYIIYLISIKFMIERIRRSQRAPPNI